MDLWAVWITGLLAGGLSCAVVQGGLLTGVAASKNAATPLTFIAAFLAGRLLSHTVFGLFLGATGQLTQFSYDMRTAVQLTAALAIITFGLARLNVPRFRDIKPRFPRPWEPKALGERAGLLTPFVTGALTILIPCGVTLSVETLAVASGSAWSGALIMGVFILGTSPVFVILGYFAKRAARKVRSMFSVAAGIAILAMGFYTFNGALELAGSPVTVRQIALAAGIMSAEPTGSTSAVTIRNSVQNVMIVVRSDSFTPHTVTLAPGIPTILTLRSQETQGCIRTFVIPSRSKQWTLPENGDIQIHLGALRPGTLRFTCGMGMYSGQFQIMSETAPH